MTFKGILACAGLDDSRLAVVIPAPPAQPKHAPGDMLGYVRVRVNRQNALHSAVSVWLDQTDYRDQHGKPANPPGTVARLYLHGTRFHLEAQTFAGVPVSECVPGQEETPTHV